MKLEKAKKRKSYKIEQVKVSRCSLTELADARKSCWGNSTNTEAGHVDGESALDRALRGVTNWWKSWTEPGAEEDS